MSIMSFQTMLYIWLALTFAAFVGGSVARIMDRRTRNLSGVSYHAPTDPAASAHVPRVSPNRRQQSTASSNVG